MVFKRINAFAQASFNGGTAAVIDFYAQSKLQLLARVAKIPEQPEVFSARLMNLTNISSLALRLGYKRP